jgi:transposase InsO family protein
MLGIDHPRAGSQEVESGADAGILGSEQRVRFKGQGRVQVYAWVTRTLRAQGYRQHGKVGKGLLRRYLGKMTGLSRAQVTRLIRQYRQNGEVKPALYRRHRFASKYTRADLELLAALDEAHETLSGPATRKILEREWKQYHQGEYERLAGISVAQLYRLRQRTAYRQRRLHYTKTRTTPVSIGERRRPQPAGRPGYLRVDTVHQGDQNGVKGVYHINAVDEVTQWQVVGAAPYISEAWLEPVLQAILQQFPFRIRGFHSDNGSEFLNQTVEKLLNQLLIEQTKSRPRHSNDNGLVESKNGAVIRKHLGYGHIAAGHAERLQSFYQQHFNPYLNFHRPCGQPELVTDAQGKQKRVYRRYATPWEVFRRLPKAAHYLKPGQSLRALAQIAQAQSDTAAARTMQQAKRKLFASLEPEKTSA